MSPATKITKSIFSKKVWINVRKTVPVPATAASKEFPLIGMKLPNAAKAKISI
jgi:hypothetical protein